MDVAVAAEPSDDPPSAVPHGFGTDQEPAVCPIVAAQPSLGVVDDLVRPGVVPGLQQAGQVIGVDHLAPPERQGLFGSLPSVGIPAVVQVAEAAVRVAEPDHGRRKFGQRLEALLGDLALMDVEGGSDPAAKGPVDVVHGAGAGQEPAVFAVDPTQRKLDLVGSATRRRREPCRTGRLAMVGMDHAHPAGLAGLSGGQAGVVVPIGVAVGDRPVRVGEPDHLRADLDEGTVTQLAGLKGGAGLALACEVPQDLEEAEELAVLGRQGLHLARGPEAASVLAYVPTLVGSPSGP